MELIAVGTCHKFVPSRTLYWAESQNGSWMEADNLLDVICSIDSDGKFTEMSSACVHTWDYRPEELIGTRFIDLVVPEDHAGAIKSLRAVRLAGSCFETRTRRKDGTDVDILWTASWSESDRRMFCVGHDITVRKNMEKTIKQSDRRLRSILENLPVGLLLLSLEGYIESMNPTMEKMVGKRVEQVVGLKATELFDYSGTASEFASRVKETCQMGIGTSKLRGMDRSFELRSICIDSPDGEKLLVIVTDASGERTQL